jgi:hypothetical protein
MIPEKAPIKPCVQKKVLDLFGKYLNQKMYLCSMFYKEAEKLKLIRYKCLTGVNQLAIVVDMFFLSDTP